MLSSTTDMCETSLFNKTRRLRTAAASTNVRGLKSIKHVLARHSHGKTPEGMTGLSLTSTPTIQPAWCIFWRDLLIICSFRKQSKVLIFWSECNQKEKCWFKCQKSQDQTGGLHTVEIHQIHCDSIWELPTVYTMLYNAMFKAVKQELLDVFCSNLGPSEIEVEILDLTKTKSTADIISNTAICSTIFNAKVAEILDSLKFSERSMNNVSPNWTECWLWPLRKTVVQVVLVLHRKPLRCDANFV